MTLISDIYDTLPRYRETCEQIERLQSQPPTFPTNLHEPQEAAVMEILNRLETRDSFDGLVDAIAASRTESENTLLARRAIPAALNKLRAWRDQIISTSTDQILDGLRAALADVVTDAEKLAPFHDIGDAETAIAAGRVDHYSELQAISSRYVEIRQAQVKIWREHYQSESGRFGSRTSIVAMISNLEECFENWGPYISHGHWEHRRSDRPNRTIQAPWPISSGAPAGTSAQFLLWALQNGAKLWLPTFDQYETAAAELRKRANQPRPDRSPDGYIDPINTQPGQATAGTAARRYVMPAGW